MEENIMNQARKNEFIKKSKISGVYLRPRKGKSLASVLIFLKVSKPNKRTSK
jgi:hypothetical protein